MGVKWLRSWFWPAVWTVFLLWVGPHLAGQIARQVTEQFLAGWNG